MKVRFINIRGIDTYVEIAKETVYLKQSLRAMWLVYAPSAASVVPLKISEKNSVFSTQTTVTDWSS